MSPDTFAAAWLEQWVKHGGSVSIDRDTLLPFIAPEKIETARPLADLLFSIPGAEEAVIAHMRSHGLVRYYNAFAAERVAA